MPDLTSVEATGVWGARILIASFVFDFLGRMDDEPGNTPREFLASASTWLHPKRWPMCGAFASFMVGVIFGHFFHPFTQLPPTKPPGFSALVLCLVLGAVASFVAHKRCPRVRVELAPRDGESAPGVREILDPDHMGRYALAGVIAGALFWPV